MNHSCYDNTSSVQLNILEYSLDFKITKIKIISYFKVFFSIGLAERNFFNIITKCFCFLSENMDDRFDDFKSEPKRNKERKVEYTCTECKYVATRSGNLKSLEPTSKVNTKE